MAIVIDTVMTVYHMVNRWYHTHKHMKAGVFIGLWVPFMLRVVFGTQTGMEGVSYYAEVHTTTLNRMIHTIFMPITATGFLLMIPNVLGLYTTQAHKLQDVLYMSYIVHYATFDIATAYKTMIVYYFAVKYAKDHYIWYEATMMKGAILGFGGLFIQEVIGHWVSGDPASRLEAIPNAILYAIYFSVAHPFIPIVEDN
jgi:uncharacterized membrane protein YGL010W